MEKEKKLNPSTRRSTENPIFEEKKNTIIFSFFYYYLVNNEKCIKSTKVTKMYKEEIQKKKKREDTLEIAILVLKFRASKPLERSED